MSRRRVVVVTGSRADWSHLSTLHGILVADPRFDTRLVVTGSHLLERHGFTIDEIIRSGCVVDARFPVPEDAAAACASVITQLAAYLVAEAISIVVVLGDRFEILGAATAALLTDRAIAHIHGGETTTGAFDEQIRHAVSKMATFHFVAARPYVDRLVAMGEPPERIFLFGPPIHDVVRRHLETPREDIEASVGRPLGSPLVSLTYHPTTRGYLPSGVEAEAILRALDRHPGVDVVVSGVNADPGAREITSMLSAWVEANPRRAVMVASLGHARYIGLLALCDAMIGNSSSGYIEGPAIGLPVIDVGDRQTGRLRSANIVRVGADVDAIDAAIAQALVGPRRRAVDPVYGAGPFAERAAETLANVRLGREALRKPFHDVRPLGAA